MTGMFSCDPLKAPVISASFYLIDSSKVSRLDRVKEWEASTSGSS